MTSFRTVDEYFSAAPPGSIKALTELRKVIRQAAPNAEEVISYNIPAFKWQGVLVWYAAYKNHVGLYPKGSGIEAFKQELTGCKTSKGAIQFRLDKAIPAGLVKRIVKFRIKENEKAGRRTPGLGFPSC